MTGPNPVDRGKSGSKIHVLSDRAGLPLAVAVSAANTHDSYALKPLVMAIPSIKSRHGRRLYLCLITTAAGQEQVTTSWTR
jgi:transposase